MKNIILVFIFLNTILQAYTFHAIKSKEMNGEQRVALVIGNNDYMKLPHLKNPLNDARLIRDTLKKRGFNIIYKENAKKKDMKKLVKKFAHQIRKGGMGICYFAGHSVNVDGKIYLVGIDSLLDNKSYVEHETILLNNIIKKMRNAHNRLNIIILDTSRNTITSNTFENNPFDRGVSGGLLSVANTKGIYIAYATASSELIRDGKRGSNGILTKSLVQNLKKKSITIKEVFENTKRDVYNYTNTKQNHSTYNQIMKDFFFILPANRQKK